MINLLGNRKSLCDGLTRRDLLQIGGIGAWGLTAAGLAQTGRAESTTAAEAAGFGKAKRCIFIYLFGAAPQHETFDPKPDAAAEVQGELKAISTSVSGVSIGEGLPQTAQVADRMTIVRSMTHPYPLHGVAYAISGLPVYSTDFENRPRDPALWPYVGSMADQYWTRTTGRGQKSILQHVGLPWVLNSQSEDYGPLSGPYGAFLGQQFDPVWVNFQGQALKAAPKCRHEQPKEYVDPYAACSKDSRFIFQGADQLPGGVTDARFQLRRSLLSQFDSARSEIDRSLSERDYGYQQSQALSLLTSPQLRQALDLNLEPESIRERYGYTLFGQSCLAARRLVEAGSRFISVFWDAYGTYFSGGWDTHQNHYPRLKQYLLPGFDPAFATLILDLEQRGLLDETLIVCTTEHGRTPKIDGGPAGAARHHWSKVYSTVLAGGGVHAGAVVGKSDPLGGDVAECPITPKDIQATALHLLGVPPESLVYDRQSRPYPLAGAGEVRPELIA